MVDGMVSLSRHNRLNREFGCCRRGIDFGELAHQFLFEVDAEIIVRNASDGRRRLARDRPATTGVAPGCSLRRVRRVRWQAAHALQGAGRNP